jgi:hypothetical protein
MIFWMIVHYKPELYKTYVMWPVITTDIQRELANDLIELYLNKVLYMSGVSILICNTVI